MTLVFFLAILLLALIIFALIRLAGFRVGFEPIFKVLATGVVMLPVLIMILLIVFCIEAVVCVGVLLMLQLGGFQVSDIPDRYVRLGIWVLIAMTPAVWGLIVLVGGWFESNRRVAEKPKAEKNIMTTPRTSPGEWNDAEFARHCGALRRLKEERGWLTEAEWDDLDTEKQCAAFRQLAEERKKRAATPANDNV
jgi:hypothetical protein